MPENQHYQEVYVKTPAKHDLHTAFLRSDSKRRWRGCLELEKIKKKRTVLKLLRAALGRAPSTLL